MKHHLRSLLSLVMVVTAMVALGAGSIALTASPASARCADAFKTFYSTPYAGRRVWIPTSDASDWATGGSITRTIADGETRTYTRGSSHSIGVDGKVGGKIGPIGAEVTVKYNYTHSKSTATSTSLTKSWAYSFAAVAGKTYRARAYKLGRLYKYKATKLDAYCRVASTKWLYAAAPLKGGATNWMREYWAKRGNLRYDNL